MFTRLFPPQFDNAYRGQRLAIWLLIPVVLAKLAMGGNSIINTHLVVATADGIPIDRYPAGAAEAVLALFALGGLFQVLLGLQGLMVLARYRAMIPFIYFLLLLQQVGSRAILFVHPIARSGVPTAQLGSAFVLAILALSLIGFVVSLSPRSAAQQRE